MILKTTSKKFTPELPSCDQIDRGCIKLKTFVGMNIDKERNLFNIDTCLNYLGRKISGKRRIFERKSLQLLLSKQ